MIEMWAEPPKMDVGAPQPILHEAGDALWLAYRTTRENHFAVVRFTGVQEYQFGPPSDADLEGHRRSGAGDEIHSFHELRDPDLLERGLRRWVVSFQDDTLEVMGRSAAVVVRAIEARDAGSALAMVQG